MYVAWTPLRSTRCTVSPPPTSCSPPSNCATSRGPKTHTTTAKTISPHPTANITHPSPPGEPPPDRVDHQACDPRQQEPYDQHHGNKHAKHSGYHKTPLIGRQPT